MPDFTYGGREGERERESTHLYYQNWNSHVWTISLSIKQTTPHIKRKAGLFDITSWVGHYVFKWPSPSLVTSVFLLFSFSLAFLVRCVSVILHNLELFLFLLFLFISYFPTDFFLTTKSTGLELELFPFQALVC